MKKVRVSTWPDRRKITIVRIDSNKSVWTKAMSVVRKKYPEYKDAWLMAELIK